MTTEELLEQLEAEAQSETPVCVIDHETRTITVPPEYQLLGVENDKRVERIPFRCPKIVGDNQDLSQNYQLYINYQNANGDPDAYHIDDMSVEEDNITFSWLLEENVTKYKGSIKFAFGAIKPGDELLDPDKNRWNTTINTDCTVLTGLKCTQQVAESNPDALAQIWAAIDELKAGGGASGKDGREVELQNNGTAIQWRYVGDESWTDLVQLSDLKGEGIPEGGTTGQVLTKNSNSDGDASWKNPSGVSDEQVKTAVRDYFEENPVSGMTSDQIMALDGMLKLCAFTENPSNQYTMFCKAFGIGIQEPEPSREIYLSEYCVFETGDALGINSSDKRIGVKVSYDFEIGDTIKLISPIGDNYMLAVGSANYVGPWIGGGYLDSSNEHTFSDSDISGGYGKVLLIKRTDEAIIQQDDIDNIKICLVVIKHG